MNSVTITGRKPWPGGKVLLDSAVLEKAKVRSFTALFLQNLQKLSGADTDFLFLIFCHARVQFPTCTTIKAAVF